jgi:hypothetical protein
VANQVLGGGVSSRLFMDLRELRSLSYGVYARMGENVGASQWFAGGQVRTAVTGDALHALFRHLECLTTEAAPDPELAMTRSYLTDSFALSIETPGNVADLVSAMRIYGLPADYYDTLRARVTAVDAAAELAAARRYIHPDHALVVVVGTADAPVDVGPPCAAAAALAADAPFAQQLQACQARAEGAAPRERQALQEVLRTFGPVRVVDLEGRTVRELTATTAGAPPIRARCEELSTPALQSVAHAGQH